MPLLQAQSIIASQALIFREIQHEAQNNQTTTRTPGPLPWIRHCNLVRIHVLLIQQVFYISFNSRGGRDL